MRDANVDVDADSDKLTFGQKINYLGLDKDVDPDFAENKRESLDAYSDQHKE